MMLFLNWKQIQDTGRIMDKYGTFLFPIYLSKIHTRPITSLPEQSPEAPRCFPVCSASVLLYFQLSVWVMRQKWVIFCNVTHFLYLLLPWFSILTCNCVKGVSSCMQLCEGCFFFKGIDWKCETEKTAFTAVLSAARGWSQSSVICSALHQCRTKNQRTKTKNFWLKHEGNNLKYTGCGK